MTVIELNWKKWAPLIALAPLIILLLLLFVWPIAGIFGTSFTEGETMFAPYAHALGSEVYRQTFYDDQRLVRGGVENRGRVQHLLHEGGHACAARSFSDGHT